MKNDDNMVPWVFCVHSNVISESFKSVTLELETILTIANEMQVLVQNAHNSPRKQSKTRMYRLGVLKEQTNISGIILQFKQKDFLTHKIID